MIIDDHAHAYGEFLNADNILRILDENSVDAVLLCPGELNKSKSYAMPDLADKFPNSDLIYAVNRIIKFAVGITGSAKQIDKSNEFVYNLVRQAPARLIQFYWINPEDNASIDEIKKRYAQWKFKGIKLHQCWNNFKFSNENMKIISSWAAENRLPIFIHIASQEDAKDLLQLVTQFPDTNYIVAHLIGIEVFAQSEIHNNLFFDMSNVQLIPQKKLLLALRKFGPARILMGSDTPIGKNNLRNAIKRVNSMPITEDEKRLILGGNIKSLLQLE